MASIRQLFLASLEQESKEFPIRINIHCALEGVKGIPDYVRKTAEAHGVIMFVIDTKNDPSILYHWEYDELTFNTSFGDVHSLVSISGPSVLLIDDLYSGDQFGFAIKDKEVKEELLDVTFTPEEPEKKRNHLRVVK